MRQVTATIFLGIIFAASAFSLQAQKKENPWKTLSKITYRKQYDEMLGFKIDIPVFSEQTKSLEGKEVTIRGYIIPVEGYKNHSEFVFSAFPYSMCFFCGGAGPETVMEVYAKEPIKYSTEAITIKGTLELNDSDINRLIYALKDAVFVKDLE
ncbi:MAG: hypothetical protein AAF798_00310 [Bacteroidota bacterium]